MATIITDQMLQDHLRISGVSRPVQVSTLVEAINEYVTRYTRRDWVNTTRTDEAHAANGEKDVLVLRHYPVTTLTSVTVEGTAWDVSDDDLMALNGEQGLLYRTDGNPWPNTRNRQVILVTYDGGPSEIAAGLRLAALELGSYVLRSLGGRTGVNEGGKSENIVTVPMVELPTTWPLLDRYVDHARGWAT